MSSLLASSTPRPGRRTGLGQALLLCCGLATAAQAPAGAAPLPAAANGSQPAPAARPLLPLGTGDIVSLQVFGRPELATTTYVAEDGTISVPLAGGVQVAGLSPTAAALRVAAALKSGQYLRNPQVTLLVTQSVSQQVSVLGEVRTPGRFVVETTTTVLDLLALAGGTTERGAGTVYLIRANADGKLERHPVDLKGLHDGSLPLDLMALKGGDSVYVPPAAQFYIYGEVLAPSMYPLEQGMTVLQAISRGGGFTEFASTRRIEIKRRGPDGKLITLKADPAERVQADDVINVRETFF